MSIEISYQQKGVMNKWCNYFCLFYLTMCFLKGDDLSLT